MLAVRARWSTAALLVFSPQAVRLFCIALNYWNGLYFMQRVCGNYFVTRCVPIDSARRRTAQTLFLLHVCGWLGVFRAFFRAWRKRKRKPFTPSPKGAASQQPSCSACGRRCCQRVRRLDAL
jgi:hypothetical protein